MYFQLKFVIVGKNKLCVNKIKRCLHLFRVELGIQNILWEYFKVNIYIFRVPRGKQEYDNFV